MNEQYLFRSKAVAARRLGSETVVMSALDSSLFSLNEIATAIWDAADGTMTLRQIVEEKICPQFEIDAETAYADAHGFVEELSKHGILLISDQPFSAGAKA